MKASRGADIREIRGDADLDECARVIREAFQTVAHEFGLTEANAPTNPAFITPAKLAAALAKPVRFFGLFEDGRQQGGVALEKAPDEPGVFFLERLAVRPEARHRGLGRALMDHAFEQVKGAEGVKVKIGIIDENRVLKDWYIGYGFRETGKKRFPHLPFTVCFMEKAVDAE